MNLKERIREAGRNLGFVRIGFVRARERPESLRLREWLGRGYAGDMDWLHRRLRERSDPSVLAPWAKTLVVATLSYADDTGPTKTAGISRYARGGDYHRLLRERLQSLARVLGEVSPGARAHPVVDTGAILEKPVAAAAGLGWQGKHTNLIDPDAGSWLFIGELLTDQDIEPDETVITDRCGTCTRCLEACPTAAFPEPYVLDSRRCISYLTIEHRGSIPEALRPGLGSRIFGCDVCQEVCPWNPPPAAGHAGPEEEPVPELAELLRMTPAAFRERFAGTPVRRTGWRRLLRNVAVALGNSNDPRAIAPLTAALENPDPLIREHVVWALDHLRLTLDSGDTGAIKEPA